MSDLTVASIEVNCVSGREPMHPATQISSPGLGNQMIVIAHQHIAVQSDVVTLKRFDEQLHKLGAILVVGENPLPGIAPARQMIERPFKFHSQGPCHSRTTSLHAPQSQM